MAKGIPIPDNDWIAMNVRFEDLDKIIETIKGKAITSDGVTISEWDALNKAAKDTVNNSKDVVIPPTPTPTPTPGNFPQIISFNVEPSESATATSVTITWTVYDYDKVVLVRTPAVGASVTIDVTSRMVHLTGTYTIPLVAQNTSFVLKATNANGESVSNELTFTITDTPNPTTLVPPANFTGHVQTRILIWEWDAVTNVDLKYYQLYASQTSSFDPDGNAPADMKYRITFGNQTNIVASGAGETWYGKVRQVAKSGKSAFTTEVSLTSA